MGVLVSLMTFCHDDFGTIASEVLFECFKHIKEALEQTKESIDS